MEELKGVAEGGFFTVSSSGGNHGDTALTTGQVMDQMRGGAVEDEINDAMEKEMSADRGLRDVRDVRPLDTVELTALMMASMDPKNENYKLSRERLEILSYDKLTPEELAIISQAV
jgi:hypothetical protein